MNRTADREIDLPLNPPRLSPGDRVGAYEVLGALGAGCIGVVCRARDTLLGRDVAVKALPQSLADHPGRLARLRREAQTLALLNHPNIASLYDLEESPGTTSCLVLELVDFRDGVRRDARFAKAMRPVGVLR